MDIMVNSNNNGSIVISTIHKGYRVKQTYYGYTLREAKRQFRVWLKTQ